jgi:hypothetical protein
METTFDKIIELYNKRNEFVTKIWVWIAIISLFGIIILTEKQDQAVKSNDGTTYINNQVNFPIINLEVPYDYFLYVFILILMGLIIRWVEAFQRSISFRQNVIEPLLANENFINVSNKPIPTRDVIDGMVYSTTTSVWGIIPNFQKSNHKKLNKLLRMVSYFFLKFIIIIVHFILPLLALLFTLSQLNKSINIFIKTPIIILGTVTSLAIIKAMISELKYSLTVNKIQLTQRLIKASKA